MDKTAYTILILIIIGVAFAAVILIRNVRNSIYIKAVQNTSKRCAELQLINERYDFQEFDYELNYLFRLDTKQKYDRFDFDDAFQTVIQQHQNAFFKSEIQAKKNKTSFAKYQLELNGLPDFMTQAEVEELGYNWKLYNICEHRFFEELTQKPKTSISALITKTYTSPKGQNSYSASKQYNSDDLQIALLKNELKRKQKESKEYQRRAMTNSLRYDILKRDGFRCKICGRSANDGAVLHVDHIIPIAKGGKTVPSNLRTLCDMCNSGKSDKYDNNGIN